MWASGSRGLSRTHPDESTALSIELGPEPLFCESWSTPRAAVDARESAPVRPQGSPRWRTAETNRCGRRHEPAVALRLGAASRCA